MVYCCWWCCSYHDRVHFCETLNKWRQIDITNLLIISGPTRESVERYKNDFAIEHNVDCKLHDSRSRMNKEEKQAVEQFHKEKRDDIEAELWWKENFKIFERMDRMDVREGYKYLCDQGLRVGVLEKVKKLRSAQIKSLGKN